MVADPTEAREGTGGGATSTTAIENKLELTLEHDMPMSAPIHTSTRWGRSHTGGMSRRSNRSNDKSNTHRNYIGNECSTNNWCCCCCGCFFEVHTPLCHLTVIKHVLSHPRQQIQY